MPEPNLVFRHLGLALVLGLLVGLQREHSEAGRPGMRTFTLITVLGTVTALLAEKFGGWILGAGFLGLVAALLLPVIILSREERADPGITTDIAAMVMFGVGALLVVLPDAPAIPVAIGGGVAVLLQFKPELHGFAQRLGDQDLRAIMQFALITCVILPVVPDRAFDSYGVLNPREAWLMVVLIVGISLAGYILYKFFGEKVGIVLGGLLGGAVSSTATTVAHARQVRSGLKGPQGAAVAIGLANAMVFPRILVAVSVVTPAFAETLLLPMFMMTLLTLAPAVVGYLQFRPEGLQTVEQRNPSELRSALFFGGMYLGVSYALAVVRQLITPEYLYLVAAVSGLTDMDAITLSTARMYILEEGVGWITQHGWRLLLTASLANLVFKWLISYALGGGALARRLSWIFAVPFLGGAGLMIWWR
jgi:uncharacterized membrane protein (DUF4010 family)